MAGCGRTGLLCGHRQQPLRQRADFPLVGPAGQSLPDFLLQHLALQRLALVGVRRPPRLAVPGAGAAVDDLFTFLRQPGLDATNWRAELAIRFGVILRKVWGGNRTWAGARAQSVLMSVWRTCWQQGRSALDFLSQLLRGTPVALALPP